MMDSHEAAMPYEERLARAGETAREWENNAVWENHTLLGNLEEQYGLEDGTLDCYRIDQ